jgi:hypothetical protein
VNPDPFGTLGLTARPGLTDDDVRAAWRRIAAATHPDRADGGDPARFAEASAAYAELRTRYGRGEAYADVSAGTRSRTAAHTPPRTPNRPAPATAASRPAARRRTGRPGRMGLIGRAGRGRPVLLVVRLAAAVAVSVVAFAVTGAQPAAIGLTVGAATWFLVTARHDLAPPR